MESVCQPLKIWIDTEAEGECRPCGIASLVGEYQSVLENQGHLELSKEISEALLDEKDPVGSVAQKMDEIKTKVPEELGKQLKEMDCSAMLAVLENKEEK